MSLILPSTLSQIPRYPLLYPHPSPIHPLPILSSSLHHHHPSRITLYAKREDQSSPLTNCGNKYRKLEYIIPHILSSSTSTPREQDPSPEKGGRKKEKRKITTLVTEGAIQSNHTVQVASVAKKLGLESLLLLHRDSGGGRAQAPDKAAFEATGNVQIARLLGAEVRILDADQADTGGLHADEADPFVARVLRELEGEKDQEKVGYWIPSGASLHPLGGVGYARCAFEIAAQEKGVLSRGGREDDENGEGEGEGGEARFNYIFVACGSGSTVGGLIAGVKLLEKMEGKQDRRGRQVIGILVSPTQPKKYHEERVLMFARRAGELIGLDPEKDITPDDVRLDDRFVGSEYGRLDPETKKTLALVAEKEAMLLDPVYTAKVARGMLHWAQQGELQRDSNSQDPINVLFVHTGGQSALSAYAGI